MTWGKILLIVGIALWADLAHSEVQLLHSGKDSSLFVSGLIRPEMESQFAVLVSGLGDVDSLTIFFDSPGGSFFVAQKMVAQIDQLRERGVALSTTVANGDECDSSCLVLFLAGEKRLAGPAAAFMFHGVTPGPVTNIPDAHLTEQLLDYFLSRGVDVNWLSQAKESGVFNRPGMLWFSGAELLNGSGVVHQLLTRMERLTPFNRSFDSRAR